MKSNKSIKMIILMFLTCLANAQTTITVNKPHEQTGLNYHDKVSNKTNNMSKVDRIISLAKSKLAAVTKLQKQDRIILTAPDLFITSLEPMALLFPVRQ